MLRINRLYIDRTCPSHYMHLGARGSCLGRWWQRVFVLVNLTPQFSSLEVFFTLEKYLVSKLLHIGGRVVFFIWPLRIWAKAWMTGSWTQEVWCVVIAMAIWWLTSNLNAFSSHRRTVLETSNLTYLFHLCAFDLLPPAVGLWTCMLSEGWIGMCQRTEYTVNFTKSLVEYQGHLDHLRLRHIVTSIAANEYFQTLYVLTDPCTHFCVPVPPFCTACEDALVLAVTLKQAWPHIYSQGNLGCQQFQLWCN